MTPRRCSCSCSRASRSPAGAQPHAPTDQTVLSAIAAVSTRRWSGSTPWDVEAAGIGRRARRPRARPPHADHRLMTVCDAQQDTLILHDGVRNLLHQTRVRRRRAPPESSRCGEERMLAALSARRPRPRHSDHDRARERHGPSCRGAASCSPPTAPAERRGTIGVLGSPYGIRAGGARVRYWRQRVGRAVGRALS